MLDEFGAEIEHADSRLDATMKKMSKVLHLSNGNVLINYKNGLFTHLNVKTLFLSFTDIPLTRKNTFGKKNNHIAFPDKSDFL